MNNLLAVGVDPIFGWTPTEWVFGIIVVVVILIIASKVTKMF